jgi:FixJ family two-component response regulator
MHSRRTGPHHLQEIPTIAIVDDDGSVRLAIASLVRSLGYDAQPFKSAQEFLQSSGEAACVIADLQMPGMTGVELQSALLRRGRHIPMIFITAYPDERIRAQVLERGAVGFLSKPFDDCLMIDCLQAALRRRSEGASAE